MKTFRSACLASTSFLTIATGVAQGADLAYKAPMAAYVAGPGYNWSGLYVGLNVGGGWNHDCWAANDALGFGFDPAIAEGCPGEAGATVGGQIGYRYQFLGSYVIGLEAQGNWADFSGSNASTIFNGTTLPRGMTVGLTNSDKVDALGLFTGQIGYAYGPILGYIKGGVAVTDNKYDGALALAITPARGPGASLSATDHADLVRFGGAIGVGGEYQFAPGWSVGLEYMRLLMNNQNTGFALTGLSTTPAVVLPKNVFAPGMPTRNDNISGDIDLVTVRLNYKFTAQ